VKSAREFPCYLAQHSMDAGKLDQTVYAICWPTVANARQQLEEAWFGLIGNRMALAAGQLKIEEAENWISGTASALWSPGASQAAAESTLAKLITRAPLNFSIAMGESRFRPNQFNVLFKDYFDVALFESSRRGRTIVSHVYVTATTPEEDALLEKAICKSASFLTKGCQMTAPKVTFVDPLKFSITLQLARVAVAAASRHIAGVDAANVVFQSLETKLSSVSAGIPRSIRKGR